MTVNPLGKIPLAGSGCHGYNLCPAEINASLSRRRDSNYILAATDSKRIESL